MVVVWLLISANGTFLNETSWDVEGRMRDGQLVRRARPTMMQPKMGQNVGLSSRNDLIATSMSRVYSVFSSEHETQYLQWRTRFDSHQHRTSEM